MENRETQMHSTLFSTCNREKYVILDLLTCLNIFSSVPKGVLTFQRFALPDNCQPKWLESQTPLCPLHIAQSSTIEDMHGLLQVDFANAFIVSNRPRVHLLFL